MLYSQPLENYLRKGSRAVGCQAIKNAFLKSSKAVSRQQVKVLDIVYNSTSKILVGSGIKMSYLPNQFKFNI